MIENSPLISASGVRPQASGALARSVIVSEASVHNLEPAFTND